MRALLVVVAGLGAALSVGGVMAFIFGGWIIQTPLEVSGLGPFDGLWSPPDYCLLGAVMASAGAGLTAAAWLGLCAGRRA